MQKLAEAAGIDLQKLGRVVRHSDAQSGGPGAIMDRDDTKPLPPDHFLHDMFVHTEGWPRRICGWRSDSAKPTEWNCPWPK